MCTKIRQEREEQEKRLANDIIMVPVSYEEAGELRELIVSENEQHLFDFAARCQRGRESLEEEDKERQKAARAAVKARSA